MKYLEYPELEVLSRALTFEMSECKVFTRIEAYSCKAVNKEKRLFKSLESSYLLSASTSPPAYLDEALASPFGRLDQPSARKTLFLLIATLNGAFPDHDFSNVNPTDFVREASPVDVLNSITSTLWSMRGSTGSPGSWSASLGASPLLNALGRSPIAASDARASSSTAGGAAPASTSSATRAASASLPSVVDDIIRTADCEVYTFHPDMDSDPHASVEPDEEGGEEEDEDPYNEGYSADDAGGVVSRGGTPAMDVDDAHMDDAPVFDEDMDGGFASSSYGAMPSSRGGQGAHGVESPTLQVDEDDLAGAGAGLLWSTFSFFYNRRMKRILFVSVWCRKNAALGPTPAVWTSPALSPSVRPSTNDDVPALRLPSGTLYGRLVERPGEHRVTPLTSPAKPAARARRSVAPYTLQRKGRTTRERSASHSPAPSTLAPFPHAQTARAPAMERRNLPSTARTPAQTTAFPSLHVAMHSISAPGPRGTPLLEAMQRSTERGGAGGAPRREG